MLLNTRPWFVVESVVWSVMVVAVCEGVDEWLQPVDLVGQVVDGVELVSPWAVAALDGAVELRPLGRQDEQAEALVAAGLFEGCHELGTAIDVDALDDDGMSATTLSRKAAVRLAVARPATAATVHLATGQ